VLTTSQC
jgi:hypothetical protein